MIMRVGRPPLPREHGAWAMLLTPPIIALLAAGADRWGVVAMIGWFAAYTLRGPLEALAGRGPSGRASAARAEPPVARFWLGIFGTMAAACLLPVVWIRPAVLPLLAGAGLLLGLVWWLALRGRSRSLAAGLLAVTGLMAGGPLYYLAATGSVPPAGWAITYGCLAFFAGSVFRVKALGRERRHAAFRWLAVALHLLFVAGAALAAWLDWAPPLLAVSLLPPLGMALYGARRGGMGPAANLGAVGRAEIWLTILFALCVYLSS